MIICQGIVCVWINLIRFLHSVAVGIQIYSMLLWILITILIYYRVLLLNFRELSFNDVASFPYLFRLKPAGEFVVCFVSLACCVYYLGYINVENGCKVLVSYLDNSRLVASLNIPTLEVEGHSPSLIDVYPWMTSIYLNMFNKTDLFSHLRGSLVKRCFQRKKHITV